MIYPTKSGETISDVVINATGLIDNWDDILTENEFTDWNPDLQAGDQITIPDLIATDQIALSDLQLFPVCNNGSGGVNALIEALFESLEGLSPVTAPVITPPPKIAQAVYYEVQAGMSIWDVVINATGSLVNLDAVLTANGFTDWNNNITPGDQILIPAGVILDPNAESQFNIYPVCNNIYTGIEALIDSIFATLESTWILSTGYWTDSSVWKDDKVWLDIPV